MEYIPGKCNVVAYMLSRPACHEENELCEVCTVAIGVPSKSPKETPDEHMNDEELICAPDSLREETQLVVPIHERTLILKNHHDAPMADHSGAEGTYTRIEKNFYWIGLYHQVGRTVCTTNATAKERAIALIEEVLLRYGIPRRRISDNGTQFVSAVMQQICYLLNTHQSIIPAYHPHSNTVERKNRNLKPHGLQFSSKTSITVGQRSYPSSTLLSTQPNAK
ncbi:integrase catalytic domain-containing protein [Trichonephila clavipes]|nr:integrase catalytic domain-containing protein [Trichonephila clavipes]